MRLDREQCGQGRGDGHGGEEGSPRPDPWEEEGAPSAATAKQPREGLLWAMAAVAQSAKENPHGQGTALSLHESIDALTGKPEQRQTSEVATSRTAPRGRYARSKAGWASKERSTPEGYNREKHAWQFEPPFPNGMDTSSIIDAYIDAFGAPDVVHPPKKKKSPKERKAIREKKIIQSERASLRHVEPALRKYNRGNTTTFVLGEITVKCLFFEFGGPCYHYNFTAKPENHHSADGSTKLFFSEINCPLRSENNVLLCCIVGEKDAGHCHACEDYRPTMVHPSSRAYGGGNTTAIDILMRTAQARIVTISFS
ncbi:uncharacterized protein C2845_PM05G17970 [Panicum miliaceum]|uniref:DUF3615 domain-containing protein n=1 Tax=Panicum miliaceum TaxID=4540 RepID=A0A3L6SWT5_PANMI|nr:uncharacterized protein C2845_PM05G17970 [Panicum miliaceum]